MLFVRVLTKFIIQDISHVLLSLDLYKRRSSLSSALRILCMILLVFSFALRLRDIMQSQCLVDLRSLRGGRLR
jgi:hypothetical protein